MQVDYPTTQILSTAICTAKNSHATGSTVPYCLINRLSHISPGKGAHTNPISTKRKDRSYVKLSAHFVGKIKEIIPQDLDVIVSFDVKSLFTRVSIAEAMRVVREKLAEGESLEE